MRLGWLDTMFAPSISVIAPTLKTPDSETGRFCRDPVMVVLNPTSSRLPVVLEGNTCCNNPLTVLSSEFNAITSPEGLTREIRCMFDVVDGILYCILSLIAK